jgi:peptidoglycan/LPS O-acetylase OafA/YrhL
MKMDFSEARNLKRFPLLDASRGLACVGVVAMHSHLDYLMPWYWGVMDFFFVMSGLLITRSLMTNCDKGRGTWSFLLYRALRLLPAYLTIMLLYVIAAGVTGERDPSAVLPYLFLYQHTDMIFGARDEFSGIYEMLPYWSLILEEHYYVLWGVFFCGVAYARLKITPATVGAVALMLALALILRKAGVHYWTLPGRFDGFLVGSVAGIIIFMPHKVRVSGKLASWLFRAGALVTIAAAARLLWRAVRSYQHDPSYAAGIWLDVSCYTMVSLVLVLGLLKMDIRRMRFGRAQDGLAFIGLISYEIYLVHFPLATFLKKGFDFNFHNGGVLLFLVTMVLSSALAWLMHRTLTAPALKRRERIYSFFVGLAGQWADGRAAAPILIPVDESGPVSAPDDDPDPRRTSHNP